MEIPAVQYSRPTIYLILAAAILVLGIWTFLTPAGITGKADAVGYAICHRIEVRSFIAGDYQLPLCARCTGIYLGAMTGLGVLIASGRHKVSNLPNWRVGIGFGLFVAIMGLDGLNSYFTLFPGYSEVYAPRNWLRLTTGVFCGLSLINFVFPIFNQSLWADGGEDAAPIRNYKELAGLSLIASLMIALVLVENRTLLLILGLISAAGVVIVLTMIMTVGVVSTTGRFRTYTAWKELAVPLVAGFTLALVMVGAIDLLRYSFTGTWDGFLM